MFRSAATILLCLSLAFPAFGGDEAQEMRAELRSRLLAQINADRKAHDLPPVALDAGVSTLGDSYCWEQIRHGTTGHFTIDGLSPYMRYSFAGGDDAVTENAAAWSAPATFTTASLGQMARRSHAAMMAERPPRDGHRRAILDPWATHVGIGLAWKGGEFRLVQEFVRRWLTWSRPFPRYARLGDSVRGSAHPVDGATVEAISVHFEPLPAPLTASVASDRDEYALPRNRREYGPLAGVADSATREIRTAVRRPRAEGFERGRDGGFVFEVPFTDGPGIYTVVVWVRPAGSPEAIAASNVSIRVDRAIASAPRGGSVTR
jgi:uncharacterized protein YkwD